MVKVLFHILLILPLLAKASELNDFIGLLSQRSPLSVEAQVCSPPLEPVDYFETDELKQGPKQVKCPEPWDDREFFRLIHVAHCSNRFGSSAFTCVEQDAAKLEERHKNAPLMNRMKTYTEEKFAQYKKGLATECCGGNVKCLTRFNAIRLSFTDKNYAHYQYSPYPDNKDYNLIQFGTKKLAGAYNTENIDRVLLAELGHACQYSLVGKDNEAYKKFASTPTNCEKSSGLMMFKEGLGEELAQCLIDEVESQIKNLPEAQKKSFCFGSWYREVFSDMKFRKHYTSIYHWTYDMGRRSQNADYASAYKTLKCVMPKDWKASYCAEKTVGGPP